MPQEGGSIRLCGDYRTTTNEVLEVEQYPLPKLEELFAVLLGRKISSKLDLNRTYHQAGMERVS